MLNDVPVEILQYSNRPLRASPSEVSMSWLGGLITGSKLFMQCWKVKGLRLSVGVQPKAISWCRLALDHMAFVALTYNLKLKVQKNANGLVYMMLMLPSVLKKSLISNVKTWNMAENVTLITGIHFTGALGQSTKGMSFPSLETAFIFSFPLVDCGLPWILK